MKKYVFMCFLFLNVIPVLAADLDKVLVGTWNVSDGTIFTFYPNNKLAVISKDEQMSERFATNLYWDVNTNVRPMRLVISIRYKDKDNVLQDNEISHSIFDVKTNNKVIVGSLKGRAKVFPKDFSSAKKLTFLRKVYGKDDKDGSYDSVVLSCSYLVKLSAVNQKKVVFLVEKLKYEQDKGTCSDKGAVLSVLKKKLKFDSKVKQINVGNTYSLVRNSYISFLKSNSEPVFVTRNRVFNPAK